MQLHLEEEEVMRRFLLGQLNEDERKAVEERFFSDSAYFESLLAFESALADQYARGELSPETREHFDNTIRSSAYQWQEVEFARDLMKALRTAAMPAGQNAPSNFKAGHSASAIFPTWKPPLSRWAIALIACLVLAIGSVLLITNLSRQKAPHPPAEAMVQERETPAPTSDQPTVTPTPEATNGSTPIPGPSHSENSSSFRATPRPSNQAPQRMVTLVLTPAITPRSVGGSPMLKINPAAKEVEIQIRLQANAVYEKYGVLIKSADGKKVWQRFNLLNQKDPNTISLIIPVHRFPVNDYILTLKGAASGSDYQDIHDYLFSVRK